MRIYISYFQWILSSVGKMQLYFFIGNELEGLRCLAKIESGLK